MLGKAMHEGILLELPLARECGVVWSGWHSLMLVFLTGLLLQLPLACGCKLVCLIGGDSVMHAGQGHARGHPARAAPCT